MTLIVKNVKQAFVKDFEALAKKTEASLSAEQTNTDSFQQLSEYGCGK